jgi:6-phosphogluconolactonase (cycloisomerase 2 family)
LTPFGFVFGHDNVAFVSDAAATTAGSSSVASYNVADDGNVAVITPALTFPEAAACWLVVPQNGRFAYTANAASGTIASFAIGEGGSLSLLQAVAGSTGNGSTPTDMAVSGNSRFLYVRDGGTGSVNGFQIEADGGLTPITTATGLPNGAQGIASR